MMERLMAVADKHDMVVGEPLEHALDAFAREQEGRDPR
jgi:hypothetical protein